MWQNCTDIICIWQRSDHSVNQVLPPWYAFRLSSTHTHTVIHATPVTFTQFPCDLVYRSHVLNWGIRISVKTSWTLLRHFQHGTRPWDKCECQYNLRSNWIFLSLQPHLKVFIYKWNWLKCHPVTQGWSAGHMITFKWRAVSTYHKPVYSLWSLLIQRQEPLGERLERCDWPGDGGELEKDWTTQSIWCQTEYWVKGSPTLIYNKAANIVLRICCHMYCYRLL